MRRIAKSPKRHLRLGSEGRATIRLLTVTVVGGYRAPPESFMATTRRANSAKMLRFRIPAKLYSSETLLEQRPHHYHLPWPSRWDGGRRGRGARVIKAMCPPVRPAVRWMRVVSGDSERVISGRMVVRRRASIDFSSPVAPTGYDGQNASMSFGLA